MSAFDTAITAAMSTLRTSAGNCVQFWRGDDWVALTAVPGQTHFEIDDGNGVVVEYRSKDFIVAACHLVIDAAVVEPRRGDLIKETSGGKVITYEVMRPDGNEQVFRYMDAARTNIRIHCKVK